MAIPFYDPKVNNTNNNNNNNNNNNTMVQAHIGSGDQVDGFINHSNSNSNYVITMPEILTDTNDAPSTSTTTNETNLPDFLTSTSTDEDIMPWKLLALTMCKILKSYYQQHLNANSLDNANTNSSEFLNNLSN